ncbi:protein of unknown function [Pseudomonas marincola]|uniref:Uncharacterized protein n=1 Tax=Pseudomonas marincola TaxID=437900 RepID=A0A8S2BKF7_9PSED|nr:protein of unknown function [Pseudomonas marincola]
MPGDHQRIHVIVAIEVFNDLFQADQRIMIPGVGRRMIDGDQGRVAVFLYSEFVGQVENPRVVRFYCSRHMHPHFCVLAAPAIDGLAQPSLIRRGAGPIIRQPNSTRSRQRHALAIQPIR